MKAIRLGNRSLFLVAVTLTFSTWTFAAPGVAVKLPFVFEPNQGQAPKNVHYVMREGALEGEFRKDSVRLRLLSGKKNDSQVSMRLVGARQNAAIAGDGALEGHSNYLLGSDPARWLRGVPNYSKVRYSQIYSGTDLVFYGNNGALEHDFELQPGADPSRIAFQLAGAERVTLEHSGNLLIELADGAITFERPVAYQTVAGGRRHVDAAFTLDRNGTVRFRLGSYNRTEKLVIDPVLSFATYLDTLSDTVSAVATDAAGNTFITGLTFNATYPVTSGAFDQQCTACTNNQPDVFVTKLNATGTSQVYSTFLGGSEYSQPSGLVVDLKGNAIVTGYTQSADFPLKNPISAGTPSYQDGFVTSLSPDGASLNFSSRLGGTSSQGTSAYTFPGGVAVDGSGNVFVAGTTESAYLPVTPGALDAGTPSYGTDNYVFLIKLQQTGNLVYGALLGDAGTASDCCYVTGVAVDSSENAYVAGTAGVTIASYASPTPVTPWPITTGAYQSEMISPGDTAPFAAKVSADGSTLLYSTLVTTGETHGMALNSDNQLILVGAPNYNYPVTADAYSSAVNSSFIAELSADGSQLLYSSYFGGDQGYGTAAKAVTVDGNGNIWLAGSTSDGSFPLVTPLVAQLPFASFGSVTSFLSEFDPNGTQLKFSTFMGDLSGSGLQIALDSSGNVHAAGTSTAPIYTTAGAFIGAVTAPPANVEYTYPYAALINPNIGSATVCTGGAGFGLSFGYLLPQTTATQNVNVTNCGSAPLTISSIASSNAAFSVTAGGDGCTGTIAVNGSCMVTVEFAPTAVQAYSGQLTFTSNATIPTTSISLTGSGGEPSAGFGPPGLIQTLIFSPTLIGQTSEPEFIPLYNNGTVPLTINLSQIAVSTGFALGTGGTCTSTLAPNQSCIIFVVFAPTTAGTITGTLSVSSNDPVHPTISTSLSGTAFTSYPIATVTALLNPSYPINSGTSPITMSVLGANFFPSSVVYINGVAQTTTYRSGSFLTTTFNPSLLNAVGSIPVTVVNPTPGGGSSAPYPLYGYLSIPLTASALVEDPVGGLLYAAIPASAVQNPSTVIPINPATGATMTPIAVSSDPQKLAVSDDGSELYVGTSAGVLQRINLKTLTIEKTFSLPVDSEWGQTYPQEMHVVPGVSQSIVVELFAHVDPAEDGLALYNDSGLVSWLPGVGVHGSPSSPPLGLDSFTFTSPTMIYGLPEPQLGTFFLEVQANSSGLSYTGASVGETNVPPSSIVRSDGTLLYTNSGEVWNPSTMALLGTYLEANGNNLFYTPSVVPDMANGHTYFLDGDGGYSQFEALTIDVYNQASYALLGTVPFTTIYSPDATDLVRWGSNGFAFRCVDITGSEPSANQVVIVTSSLVPPGNATPVPILLSVSPPTVQAGGPAFTLQLTGSGFTSASTVLINGNSRTTAYISSTSLTAQVLASDIATPGQFEVQVNTPAPGGGTSNYVNVSLTPPPMTTPAVTLTPSTTSITTAQTLVVTVSVSGTPTPTGSIMLSGGGYSNTQTLNGGSATFTIAAGSLDIGSDVFTANYTPDANSPSYTSATGTNSVTVNPAPSFTLAPAASTLAVVQGSSNTDTITVSPSNGFSGSVTFSASGLPGGVIASFGTNPATGSSVLTLTAASAATVGGPVTVTISGISGSLTASTTVALTVNASPTFTLALSTSTLSVVQGSSNTDTITVSGSNGFSGAVTLAASGLPSGVTSSFGTNPATGSSVLTLTASAAAEVTSSPVTVTITGNSGSLTASTTIALTVTQAPTFVVGGGGSSLSIEPGATSGNTVAITVTPSNGFTGAVNLTCSVTPAAASDPPTCTLSPSSVTITGAGAQSSTLTIFSSSATTAKNEFKKLLWPSAGTALAGIVLIGIPRRRRNWLAMLGVLALFAAFGAIGCGGGGSSGGGGGGGGGGGNSGTTPGTYTVTVTGTSGNITGTVGTVTLTIQ